MPPQTRLERPPTQTSSRVHQEPSASPVVDRTTTSSSASGPPTMPPLGQGQDHQLVYSNDVIEERRYGCYRLGIVFAVAIILVLLAGTVLPSVLVVSNRQLLLIATCCTLIVVAVLIFVYTCCQHRTARKQRQLCDRGDASTTSNRRFATITSIGSPIMMPSSTSTDRTGGAAWRYKSVPTTTTDEQNQQPQSNGGGGGVKHQYQATTPTSWSFRSSGVQDRQPVKVDYGHHHTTMIKPNPSSKHTLI